MTLPYTFSNGTLADGTQVNSNFSYTLNNAGKFSPMVYWANINNTYDVICHSATTWTWLNGTSTLRTTDAGVTWVAPTSTSNYSAFGCVCRADKTKAISFAGGNFHTSYTTDSGANWTTAATNVNQSVCCADFPTATCCVLGHNGTTYSVSYSTDGGNHFTVSATKPTVEVVAISMYDGTTGYLIDINQHIWKTTDGGVNWTDTTAVATATVSSGGNVHADIMAISATEFIIVDGYNATIQYWYNNGSNQTYIWNGNGAGSGSTGVIPFKPIKLTNGTYYAGFFQFQDTSRSIRQHLFKFTINPSSVIQNCQVKDLRFMDWGLGYKVLTSAPYCTRISEYDTNKLLIKGWQHYMLMDES